MTPSSTINATPSLTPPERVEDAEDDTESDEEAYSTPPTQPRDASCKPTPPADTPPSPDRPRTRSQQQTQPDPSPPHSGENVPPRSASGERTRVQQPGEELHPTAVDTPASQDPRLWVRGADVPDTAVLSLDCQLIKPDAARKAGHVLQLPVGPAKAKHPLHLRRLVGAGSEVSSPSVETSEARALLDRGCC